MLFNAKSCLDIYIEYIRFSLVVCYGVLTIEDYVILDSFLYT